MPYKNVLYGIALWDQNRWSYNQGGLKIKGWNRGTTVLYYQYDLCITYRKHHDTVKPVEKPLP